MASLGRRKTSRERFNDEPLRHAPDALSIDVETFSLDDDEQYFEVDKAGNQVFLEDWADDWKTLTLKGTLTIEDDLEPVFPPNEWPANAPAEVVVAVECEYTHVREGRTIEVASFDRGAIDFEITFSSRRVYGIVELTPLIVRTDDADTSGDYRYHAGLELADGPPWVVHIDETEDASGPLLPPIFKRFSESDNDERFPDDAVYVVDKRELHSPKLYVNRDHESIASALNSGPRGKLGRVMNVYTDSILLPALSELVLWTAEDVDETGDVEHDWQADLLSQVVTKMYDVNSIDEAGRELHDEFTAEGSMPQILDKTSTAIQEYLELSDDMVKLVDSIRS